MYSGRLGYRNIARFKVDTFVTTSISKQNPVFFENTISIRSLVESLYYESKHDYFVLWSQQIGIEKESND